MVFRASLANLFDVLGRAIFVTQGEAFLGDMGVYPRGDGSRVRMLQVADDEIVSWRKQHAQAFELLSRVERISAVQGQSFLKPVHDPLRETPSRPRNQTGRDVQVGELDARVLAPSYSSAGRRVPKLVGVSKQSLDITGGMHVGKDDPDVGAGDQSVWLGYMCGGTGKTGAWTTMSWKDHDLLQGEAWRDGDDHRNDRCQCGERGV